MRNPGYVSGAKQTDLVVVVQGPDRQPRPLRQLPDGESFAPHVRDP